jgi:cation diffusion facilitator CzcD-associated flavoprotein CzcO
MPQINGNFDGDTIHSALYRSPEIFKGRRVLIVGGGNSGCDIAVDAVPFATKIFHSTRRPYYYMPKFVDGKPTQEWLMDLPRQFPDQSKLWVYVKSIFKLCGYDPADYGLPSPEYEIYQAHPIMNSQILFHIGHGDIVPKPQIVSFHGDSVRFIDGSTEKIDLVIFATGYNVYFPFLNNRYLEWKGERPDTFLYAFHRKYHNLFFMGFVNAAAGFGNVANAYGRLFTAYIRALERDTPEFKQFCRLKTGPDPSLGQESYIVSERHQFETDLWKLIKTLSFFRTKLS